MRFKEVRWSSLSCVMGSWLECEYNQCEFVGSAFSDIAITANTWNTTFYQCTFSNTDISLGGHGATAIDECRVKGSALHVAGAVEMKRLTCDNSIINITYLHESRPTLSDARLRSCRVAMDRKKGMFLRSLSNCYLENCVLFGIAVERDVALFIINNNDRKKASEEAANAGRKRGVVRCYACTGFLVVKGQEWLVSSGAGRQIDRAIENFVMGRALNKDEQASLNRHFATICKSHKGLVVLDQWWLDNCAEYRAAARKALALEGHSAVDIEAWLA